MLKDMGLQEFIDQMASDAPVPGGGSVAALSGAIAAALAEMVANLTIGKKKYEEVEELMIEQKKFLIETREELLNLIDEDANAFDQVMQAFRLPKETEEEKVSRREAIQMSLKGAALAPLEIARKAYALMDYSEQVVLKGNQNAVTDGMVSAMMARTAVLSALLNVRINLASIKDESFIERLTLEVENLERNAIAKESKILLSVNL
jgi:formiminotetrahydrofolate cyclodeaminase